MLGLFLVNSINSLVVGGFKGLGLSISIMVSGSLLGGYWLGFEFNKDSSTITTVVSALCIYLYCVNIGYFNRKNTLRMSKHRKELQAAKNTAEQATRAKGDFLANMSHEIRTPMNGVLGTLQLLEQSEQDNKSKELIQKASYSAKSLLTIINDILDYSKIKANQIVFEKKPFSVLEVLNSIKADLQKQALEKRIYLKIRPEPDFVDGWVGDQVRVRQVLLNLISNAVKFTNEGGVTIVLKTVLYKEAGMNEKEAINIEVIDTGIGMTGEQRQRVFERFAQADSSTTRKFGGTGLGLTISLNLVELMQGKLQVSSAPDKGTRIAVTLPLEQSHYIAPILEPKNQTAPLLSHKKILIAEDNQINQVIINSMMEATQAQLTFAENGELAVKAFKENKFDLVLMDIQMPVMDGMQAFEHIQQLDSTVPVVALTANILTEDVQKYKALGFIAHIGKPVEMPNLYEVLAKLFP
jgi:signal transduction histidine kinase